MIVQNAMRLAPERLILCFFFAAALMGCSNLELKRLAPPGILKYQEIASEKPANEAVQKEVETFQTQTPPQFPLISQTPAGASGNRVAPRQDDGIQNLADGIDALQDLIWASDDENEAEAIDASAQEASHDHQIHDDSQAVLAQADEGHGDDMAAHNLLAVDPLSAEGPALSQSDTDRFTPTDDRYALTEDYDALLAARDDLTDALAQDRAAIAAEQESREALNNQRSAFELRLGEDKRRLARDPTPRPSAPELDN